MKLGFLLLILIARTGGAQALRPGHGRRTAPVSSLARDALAVHNAVRARVGTPPLAWSARLASRAQEWADYLLAHGEFAHRPRPVYGENLFEITGAAASASEVVDAWAEESRNYDYRTNRCRRGMCGHYTQIIWATTREVGCGVAKDRSREVWVCNYDPPGNWVGRRPY